MNLRSGIVKISEKIDRYQVDDSVTPPVPIMGEKDPGKPKGRQKKAPQVQGDPNSRFAIQKVVFIKPKDVPDGPEDADYAPPPIVVPFDNPDSKKPRPVRNNNCPIQLKATLKAGLGHDDYVIKNLDHAILIYTSNKSTYAKTLQLLDKKFEIYTYNAPGDAPLLRKFVIYDLCDDCDEGELTEDLKSYGLDPIDVKKMTIKSPRYPGHANFIVYFEASDKVTLEMAKKAEFLCHTKVRWNHYTQTQKVRQCANCLRFGHLKFTCKMNVVCFLCAQNHPVDKCPLMIKKLQMNANSIPQHLLTCANCGLHHTGISQECETRQNYIKRTNSKANPAKEPVPKPQQSTFQPAPIPSMNPWTQHHNKPIVNKATINSEQLTPKRLPKRKITVRSHSPPTSKKVRMVLTPVRPSAWSTPIAPKASSKQNKPNQPTQPPKIANPQKSQESNNIFQKHDKTNDNKFDPANDNDLFNPQEMASIFREMVSTITKCKSKADQLSALMDIAMKYTPCQL